MRPRWLWSLLAKSVMLSLTMQTVNCPSVCGITEEPLPFRGQYDGRLFCGMIYARIEATMSCILIFSKCFEIRLELIHGI